MLGRMIDSPGWKRADIYQIYPLSFQNSDDDGIRSLNKSSHPKSGRPLPLGPTLTKQQVFILWVKPSGRVLPCGRAYSTDTTPTSACLGCVAPVQPLCPNAA